MNTTTWNYRGWLIYGAGDSWAGYRHGVRLRGNRYELLVRMIDLRDNRYTNTRAR